MMIWSIGADKCARGQPGKKGKIYKVKKKKLITKQNKIENGRRRNVPWKTTRVTGQSMWTTRAEPNDRVTLQFQMFHKLTNILTPILICSAIMDGTVSITGTIYSKNFCARGHCVVSCFWPWGWEERRVKIAMSKNNRKASTILAPRKRSAVT